TKFTVTDVSADVDVRQAPWIEPTATKKVNIDASIIAGLIGVPVSGQASGADKYTVKQSFSDAQEVNTTDDGVANAKEAFYKRRGLDPRERYYLVRRAIIARSVQYDFDKDLSTSFGADIRLQVVSAKPTASYSAQDGFHYKNTFSKPENVCILAE